MAKHKMKLFSDDGIDSSHARQEPESIYFPDENTHEEIKYLFTTLRSTQNERDANGVAINITNLPYSADLAVLASDNQGNLLSMDDVSADFHAFTCFHLTRLIRSIHRSSMVCAESLHILFLDINLYKLERMHTCVVNLRPLK